VSNRRLQTDSAAFGASIDPKTISAYLDALTRLWVLDPQPAWGGHLRSAAPARKAAKRHLADPSLAAAAMGAGPEDLLADRAAFGQVFETLVFRDLSVYAGANPWDVRAFQDAEGREIDAVLVRGTQWAGIEVKLSGEPVALDAAARALTAAAGRMTSRPKFLAVVTATGPTYTRADGVHVVPATRLGP
jgi:predicted AAA+ superfamily ATPase